MRTEDVIKQVSREQKFDNFTVICGICLSTSIEVKKIGNEVYTILCTNCKNTHIIN